ncbi:fatty acyl-CoA reductase wat-like, partial [Augochlora pura]
KSLIKQNEVAKLLDEEKVPVYNSVTSPQNPTTWHDFIELNMIYGHDVPSVNSIWYFMLFFTRYTFVYRMNLFLLHIMPAFIADTIARLIGRKPILMDTYKKIHKFTGLMEHFSMNEWVFRNENVKKMWRKLNSVDRKLFNFNVENIVWTDYYYHYVRGVRQYVVNDPMETLDVAIVKHRR